MQTVFIRSLCFFLFLVFCLSSRKLKKTSQVLDFSKCYYLQGFTNNLFLTVNPVQNQAYSVTNADRLDFYYQSQLLPQSIWCEQALGYMYNPATASYLNYMGSPATDSYGHFLDWECCSVTYASTWYLKDSPWGASHEKWAWENNGAIYYLKTAGSNGYLSQRQYLATKDKPYAQWYRRPV